jgi:hypothetical protein
MALPRTSSEEKNASEEGGKEKLAGWAIGVIAASVCGVVIAGIAGVVFLWRPWKHEYEYETEKSEEEPPVSDATVFARANAKRVERELIAMSWSNPLNDQIGPESDLENMLKEDEMSIVEDDV